jgi:hypothetical protein
VATLVREAPHVDLCENARDRARARERALSLMVDDGLRSEAHERERDRTSAALRLTQASSCKTPTSFTLKVGFGTPREREQDYNSAE